MTCLREQRINSEINVICYLFYEDNAPDPLLVKCALLNYSPCVAKYCVDVDPATISVFRSTLFRKPTNPHLCFSIWKFSEATL